MTTTVPAAPLTLVCRVCGERRQYPPSATVLGQPVLTWWTSRNQRCTNCSAGSTGQPVARATDPGTSWAAARSVTNLRESQAEILRLLQQHGPMTDEQIFAHLQTWVDRKGKMISPSGARTRRAELVEKGLAEDSGKRALTKSNRQTVIWRVA